MHRALDISEFSAAKKNVIRKIIRQHNDPGMDIFIFAFKLSIFNTKTKNRYFEVVLGIIFQ